MYDHVVTKSTRVPAGMQLEEVFRGSSAGDLDLLTSSEDTCEDHVADLLSSAPSGLFVATGNCTEGIYQDVQAPEDPSLPRISQEEEESAANRLETALHLQGNCFTSVLYKPKSIPAMRKFVQLGLGDSAQ